MKSPFQLAAAPHSCIAEYSVIPIETKEDGTLILLTDGTLTESSLEMYEFLLNTRVELHNLSQHPELVGPYLLVMKGVRTGFQKTFDPHVYQDQVGRWQRRTENELKKTFPTLFTD